MRDCIRTIAENKGISSDWLNDGVKGFYDARTMPTVPLIAFENLAVERPDDESLLAMKLTSARDNGKDMTDSTVLMRALDIASAERALDIVESKIPRTRIPVMTQYFTEAVIDNLGNQTPPDRQASASAESPKRSITQDDIDASTSALTSTPG